MPDNKFVVNFIAIYFVVKSGVYQPWWSCVLTSFHVVGIAWKMLNYRHTDSMMVCFWKSELSGLLWKWQDAFLSFFCLERALTGSVPRVCALVWWWWTELRVWGGEGKCWSLNLLQIPGADSLRKLDLAPQLDYFWLLQLIFEVYFYLLLISMKLKARMVSSWGTVSECYSKKSACRLYTVLLIVLFKVLLAFIRFLYSNEYQTSS